MGRQGSDGSAGLDGPRLGRVDAGAGDAGHGCAGLCKVRGRVQGARARARCAGACKGHGRAGVCKVRGRVQGARARGRVQGARACARCAGVCGRAAESARGGQKRGSAMRRDFVVRLGQGAA